MKITTFKFQFFARVTIFSLFSGISVYAQSPNETDSLQTEEISQDKLHTLIYILHTLRI